MVNALMDGNKGCLAKQVKYNLICVLLMDRSAVTRSERQLSHFKHIWHLSEQMNPISQTTASGLSVPAGKVVSH